MSTGVVVLDPFDVRQVRRASGLLREFNEAGLLAPADVHVARRLTGLAGESDEAVALAVALAVRAPRIGHVYVDLATIRDTAAVDADEPVDLSALPWPDAESWVEGVAASGLAAAGEDPDPDLATRPLRLVGSWLYLDRYWREERRVAADLRELSEREPEVSVELLADGLARLFDRGGDDDRQRIAVASAVLRRLAVVAGGPGTGKTTTVARIVALLCEQAATAGAPAPIVALAAPTGKAAARLAEAVHEQAAELAVDEPIRTQLLDLGASTLHRLLGRRGRFGYHRGQRLPHDVVIVDETSMVPLSLMARLVEAIRPDARLVLVGDPGQLASIEAGAVLGDIVGPAAGGLLMRPAARQRLSKVTGAQVSAGEPGAEAAIADGIVVLDRVHRYGAGIARLAEAIRRGDGDAMLEVLSEGPEGVEWIATDVDADDGALAPVREGAVGVARSVLEAARAGDARDALDHLGGFRLLCAHRRGPLGIATWTARIEAWLASEIDGFSAGDRWYAGRPLLVTENDYELGLFNGDTGVVIQDGDGRLTAAFERRGEITLFSPTRLGEVDTVHAMTIHKSQGSQFDTAAVLLPDTASRILTRELLYTAATRARDRLIIVGTEEMVRAAVARPVARASGLRWRLWGERRFEPATFGL